MQADMSKTKRVCQNCGAVFYGAGDRFYCPACAKQKKIDTVLHPRVCKDCGAEFVGGPTAMRCPSCAAYARAHYKRKPTERPFGSIDKCLLCGAEYIVMASRQKYCSVSCQQTASKAAQRERKKGYHKTSGQYNKKMERRNGVKKVCIYCLGEFESHTPANLCSDYCRNEQAKLSQCRADIKRGYNRNLDKYIQKRDEYREKVKEEQNEKGN